ncbi:MAG: endo-1,4-beta-xylanase, partial [Bacteroidales bacterium]
TPPATDTLTPTATPTATPPLVAPTNEPTPTQEMSTPLIENPIPTIQVGELFVPDPRVSNPELFDLKSPDSPIVQFANAFGIRSEEVQLNDPQLIDKNGKQFIVLTTKDLSATEGFDESSTAILIAEKGMDGNWTWKNITKKFLADVGGINLGVSGAYLSDPNFVNHLKSEFNMTVSNYEFQEHQEEGVYFRLDENTFNFSETDARIKFAETNELKLQVQHLIWGNRAYLPNWMTKGDYSQDELKNILINEVTTILSRYKGKVAEWSVINELLAFPWEDGTRNGFFDKKFGGDHQWIFDVFKAAEEADPGSVKFINDSGIEFYGGDGRSGNNRWQIIFDIVREGREQGLDMNVGFQMHLYGKDFVNVSTREKKVELFKRMVEEYRNIGAEVLITEMDVRMDEVNFPENEKQMLQAQIYHDFIKAALEENITSISLAGIDDGRGDASDIKGADATLIDRSGQKKPANFAVIQAILQYLLTP